MADMTADDQPRHRITAVRRERHQVTPLELFFDLVFVLAVTQCTAFMAHDPTWEGVARGTVILGLLWWTWVGYAWLTSVVDPDEGVVRVSMFAAMAAVLVASLSIPHAFGDEGLTFALAYLVVRAAHIALFVIASQDQPALRHSVLGLGAGAAVGTGLVVGGSFLDAEAQLAVWIVALLLDVAEPYFFGSEGWQLVAAHFAERHWLIMIVALGESVVALGVSADAGLDGGELVAAVLGIVLAAALWWAYFDYMSLAMMHRLDEAETGREQNELARDCYSFLHFPMIAGIVLVAFGIHETLAHVDEPLHVVPAFGLTGGIGIYFLGHVAYRYRGFRTLKWGRLGTALVAFALLPVATEIDAILSLALVSLLAVALNVYEVIRYAEARIAVRHGASESQVSHA
jgi:low temperature requirement protein LtrA